MKKIRIFKIENQEFLALVAFGCGEKGKAKQRGEEYLAALAELLGPDHEKIPQRNRVTMRPMACGKYSAK